MASNDPKPFAMSRPPALPMPKQRAISAFTTQGAIERWAADASGLRALAQGDNVITILDVIGEDFWGDGVSAKAVASQLRAIGDRPVEVQINSPGGDMFEGVAIYNLLREHPQEVTVKVVGLAASAASVIAMAGDRVEVAESGFLMIHNCWVIAGGNRHDLADTAEWLKPFDRAMAGIYAARSGLDLAEVEAMMDKESWIAGGDAVKQGFADALLASDAIIKDAAKAKDMREINAARAMELSLCAAGMSRRQARAHIKELKGTPGAARTGTPGAAFDDDAFASETRKLIARLRDF